MKLDTTELLGLARAINDRESVIEQMRDQTIEAINSTLAEALLQGQDLLRMKALCPHGSWLNYLKAKCPKLSARRAQYYMALASSAPAIAQLTEAGSLRAALAMCATETEPIQDKETKAWPPYLDAIGRLNKLVSFCGRYRLEEWPKEGLEKFRSDLEPIAAKLWPDKFDQAQAAERCGL